MDLVRLAQRAILDTVRNEGVPGNLGKLDGTVTVTKTDGSTDKGRVWVRISDDNEVTEVVARANGVPRIPNLPIRLAYVHGEPIVLTHDTYIASEMTGGRGLVDTHAWMHGRYGVDPLFLTGLMFLPFLVRPASPPSLSVYVEEDWYRYQNTWTAWEGGSIDLTSYVPTGANLIHFVVIALNRTSNSLVVVDGYDITTDDVYSLAGAAYSDVKSLSIDSSYYPLAVVELEKNQTVIKAHSITFDLRLWGMEVAVGSTAYAIDAIMVDADGSVMVDANGNVMTES